jgi:hypothetical protein
LVSNPSLELNTTKYLLALANIGKNQEQVPVANLEPQFDLNDAWGKLEKEYPSPDLNPGAFIVVDPGWQALEETGFCDPLNPYFWRNIVIETLRNGGEGLTKFLNFYISQNFDMLVQGLHENWGMRGIEDDWRFYDLMCNYKHLDKDMKKWIKKHGADESMRRPCLWDCVCSKKSKADGYCEQTR